MSPGSKPPFHADHVGSLLRPPELREARAQAKQGAIAAEALRAIEDRSIRGAVARQEATGLQAITDGEFRRDWWHIDFLKGFDRVEAVVDPSSPLFHGADEPVPVLTVDVDGYFLEYDTERAGGFEPLRYLPKGNKIVVVGVITSKSGQLENKDDIKRRLEEASKYAPLDQLALSPQCGFASTEEGNILTEEEQWAKLRLAVDVAQEVWGK